MNSRLQLMAAVAVLAALSLTGHSARATTTFTVNVSTDASDINLADTACDSDPAAGTQCSLRAAIQEANDTSGFDTINFAIGSGQVVIMVNATGLGALPAITGGVTIDGTTQPGYNAGAPTPMVDVRANTLASGQGLVLSTSTASTIKGLAITGFPANGLVIQTGGSHTIQGNYIGLALDGTTAVGNVTGMAVSSPASAVIGGGSPAQRNVISGNQASGIDFTGGLTITGNYIGTDATGLLDRGNGGSGIAGNGSLTVGGASPLGNVISGNGGDGVHLVGLSGYTIKGNYIGLGANGTTALGNDAAGIFIDGDVTGVTVGGATAAERNLISANGQEGIRSANASGNTFLGNYIGTDVTGTLDRGNTLDGIALGTGSNNVIGGPLQNLISGNNGNGISLSGSTNVVKHNHIGISECCPTAAVPNSGDGIHITGGSSNTIGGSTSLLEGNILSGNGGDGIEITAGSGSVVKGNQIGVFSGFSPLGNSAIGLFISGPATNTTIGGPASTDRNIISGNGNDGIGISNVGNGTVIKGNLIGLASTGSIVGNGDDGIGINSGSAVTIGGPGAGDGNIISGNALNGIQATSGGHTISGNYIGTDSTGALDRGNGGDGVRLVNSSVVLVGGSSASGRNVISGNNSDGVEIAGGSDNVVRSNYIGLTADGTTDIGNTLDGVRISTSGFNVIGGSAAGFRNVISGNNTNGIEITGTGTNNEIRNNYIGIDAAGTLDRGNSADGVHIDTSDSNIIGGTTAADRNVISGNNNDGVELVTDSNSNTIKNNYIGTSADGMSDLGNTAIGLKVDGSTNTIGAGGQGNVVSANDNNGVDIQAASTGNTVAGNLIGVAADGATSLGNALNSLRIQGNSDNNQIGSSNAADANQIAYAGTGDGVVIGSTDTGNLIGLNSIHDNGALGIDLNNDNIVTPNDPAPDSDTGANNLQNFPVLTVAVSPTTSTIVVGSLTSAPLTAFTLRFYHSASCDPLGNGEGEVIVGASNVVTQASGVAPFTLSFPAVGSLRYVTATASDSGNNTSEFSNCVQVPAIIVNSVADPGDGVCNSTECTLREAITAANADPDPDVIRFAIGSGVQTISPTAALPTISTPVTIDGTTQPGFAGTPIIELNGTSAGTATDGLTITGGSSTIRGLVINRFGTGGAGNGVVIQGSGGNVIEGNYIGTNVAGTAQAGNRGNGVLINSPDNRIGGTAAAQRNVISGNNSAGDSGGVELTGMASIGNVVKGNYIGTNAAGTAKVANGLHGILIQFASGNTIGGSIAGAGNVLSGNFRPGLILHSANNNLIQGNHIGTDSSGTLNLGNNENGVVIDGGSSDNVLGGIGSAANVIAFNPGAGILVSDGTGNRLADNSFYSNNTLGIDLAPSGVNANDPGDSDTGPNNLQNFPTFTSASFEGDQTSVNGLLNSIPSTQFVVTFYYNSACDISGNGEGQIRLNTMSVTTNAGGNAQFASVVPGPGLSLDGAFITGTATDPAGNTSEFSACIQVLDDTDDDNDGFTDDAEAGTPLCANAVNDDGPPVNDDTLINDGCPAVGPAETLCADALDNDGDGRVNDGCLQAGTLSEGGFNIGTGAQDACGNNGWPADLFTTGLSANKLDIQDIVSFTNPVRHLDTSPGNPNFSTRFDLFPGKGAFGQWINIQDITSLIGGGTGFPPMFGGIRAFNQTCPWPP